MKYRVLIRAFTARRDVSCMMILKKELIKYNCQVKISSQREFLIFIKLWKPHVIILNTVGLSKKIKELSKNSKIVYIPGEGSEVGENSDANFWKNNPLHLDSLDLALLWGKKQREESKKINKSKSNIFYNVGNQRIDIIKYFLRNKNKIVNKNMTIGFAARFDFFNLHEFKSAFKILLQEKKFSKFINKSYQFQAFFKSIKIILENTNFNISIRPHPLEQVEGYYEYLLPKLEKYKNRIEINKSLEQVEWLSSIDILVSPTSSIIVTAYLYKIPFINIDKLAGRDDKTTFDIIDDVWQKCSYIPSNYSDFINLIKHKNLKFLISNKMDEQLKDYYLNNNNELVNSTISKIIINSIKKAKFPFFFNYFRAPYFLLELIDDMLLNRAIKRDPLHWNFNYHKKNYTKPHWIDKIE